MREYTVIIPNLIIVSIMLLICAPETVAEGKNSHVSQKMKVSEIGRAKRGKVEVFETSSFYEVAPTSKSDLAQSLVNASPIKRSGVGYLAETGTRFKWSIDWLTDSETCWVNNADVELHVTFLLPKLVVEIDEVNAVWLVWYPKLLKHEHNHRDIGLSIAYEMRNKLARLAPQVNCELLYERARAIVKELESKEGKLHDAYDLETNHGETEGLGLWW